MNPSSNETFRAAVPTPGEKAIQPLAEAAQKAAEQAPSGPEIASQLAGAAPAMAVPPILPLPAPPATSSAAPSTPPQNDDPTALPIAAIPLNDDDLIEKEWVNKAKAIVERTRDDPHKQSEELTMVKADYMQKHYNKTIKLSQ